MQKHPLYLLDINEIDDETGVSFISQVMNPAIQVNWQAFSTSEQRFQVESKDEQIVTGPLMLADTPIFRFNKKIGEYYVMFNKETIKKIVKKFFKKKMTDKVNLEHNEIIPGVFMIESWIIDSEKGKEAPKGFEGIPDGSWFGSFYVEDKEYWDEFIKSGKVKGFSIEGAFLQEYEKAIVSQMSSDSEIDEAYDTISKLIEEEENKEKLFDKIENIVSKLNDQSQ